MIFSLDRVLPQNYVRSSLIGAEGDDSCGKSVKLETPHERSEGGGSSHARGKRSPFAAINFSSS